MLGRPVGDAVKQNGGQCVRESRALPDSPGPKSTLTDRDGRDNAERVTVGCLIDSHVF